MPQTLLKVKLALQVNFQLYPNAVLFIYLQSIVQGPIERRLL